MTFMMPDAYRGRTTSTCRGVVCNTRLGQVSIDDLLADTAGISTDTEYAPVMTYQGVSVAQSRAEAAFADYPGASAQAQGLGGWLEYNAFGVTGAAAYEGAVEDGYAVALLDHTSGGDSTRTRPARQAGGTATWNGAMVAADLEFLHAVMGAATVTMDLADLGS